MFVFLFRAFSHNYEMSEKPSEQPESEYNTIDDTANVDGRRNL